MCALDLPMIGDPLWQPTQLVEPTGMCPLGLPLTDTPLWQLAQFVAALKLP